MKLYLASGNAHKAQEFQTLVETSGLRGALEIESARALGGMPEVDEDTGTFVGNARKKAVALREKLLAGGGRGWVMADDSGLCVEALGGEPGVESAYYAGPQGDSAANLAKLVSVMRGVEEAKRGAYFVCVLFVIGPDGAEFVFEGRCPGRLAHEPRGGGGFGYDPVFVPDGFELSFSELGDDVKNKLSHRGRAWEQAAVFFKKHSGRAKSLAEPKLSANSGDNGSA